MLPAREHIIPRPSPNVFSSLHAKSNLIISLLFITRRDEYPENKFSSHLVFAFELVLEEREAAQLPGEFERRQDRIL